MLHPCRIELSKSALHRNIRFLKKRIGPNARFSSVVKGNAYGHGIETFVPLAETCGVNHFSVFAGDEALKVLNSRTRNSDIMIMGHIDNDELDWAIENEIEFYIFGLDRLQHALAAMKKVGKPARIHLQLETGMNRTGLEGEELQQAVNLIRDNPESFKIEGVCTHYAGAESVGNYLRIQHQIQRFNELCEWLSGQGMSCGRRHTASSAAAFTYPETIMDMVRFGIAHYGYWPSKETRMHYHLSNGNGEESRWVDPLRRVISWKSRVMSVKTVKPGEFIGYGTSSLTTKKQTVAAVPVGYAHGFARNLSNLGHVLVHGRRAPVVGMVNMNMILVDITDFPPVHKGDEVVIIGRQKNLQITVASFSDLVRYLNYEVLVRLPADIPRKIVD